MRKSVSDLGSKNYSSPQSANICEPKIGPIDDSFLIRSPQEGFIPTNNSYVPAGFILTNQVLIANHFSSRVDKRQVIVTSPQTDEGTTHGSIFQRMFKRQTSLKGQENVKNIHTTNQNGLCHVKDEDLKSSEERNESDLGNKSSNTLPHECIIPSSISSPFKMSYSSDEIDRLLQMTPEKSRWNRSEKKKKVKKLKGRHERSGNDGNERKKSLKESSSTFFSPWSQDGDRRSSQRNDDESLEDYEKRKFGERLEVKESMNNKEDRLDVSGIPRRRTCSLCLEMRNVAEFHTIWSCGCSFCRQCLSQYLMTCIRENLNVPFLSCPSADCPQIHIKSRVKSQTTSAMKQVLSRTFTSFIHDVNSSLTNSGCNLENKFSRQEIEMLVDEKCFDLYLKLKTEYEVEMDPNRTFCPSADCGNICIISKSMIVTTDPAQIKSTSSSVMISSLSVSSTISSLAAASSSAVSSVIKKSTTTFVPSKETDALPVLCNKCDQTFCCTCRKQPFHFGSQCSRPSLQSNLILPFDSNGDGPEIKRCPRCSIWIEREDGCAQMMCRKCRHVFCWFCLQSLEDDLLLRHFDHGPCKNKLGHSRASVIWHRTQVVGIFAGFGVLLLLASPLFLVAAPCFFCCSCCCSSLSTLTKDEEDEDEENISHLHSLHHQNDDDDEQEIITKQPSL